MRMRPADFIAWVLGAVVYVWLTGCRVVDSGGSSADDLVGYVYVCGELELCYGGDPSDLAEEVGEPCRPTPRHAGLCLFRCPGGTGCNAMAGCWCGRP